MSQQSLEAALDAEVLTTFGEPAILAGNSVCCIFEPGIEVEEDSGVIVVVDAATFDQSVALGSVLSVRDRDYTVNRFLDKDGGLRRYELA